MSTYRPLSFNNFTNLNNIVSFRTKYSCPSTTSSYLRTTVLANSINISASICTTRCVSNSVVTTFWWQPVFQELTSVITKYSSG